VPTFVVAQIIAILMQVSLVVVDVPLVCVAIGAVLAQVAFIVIDIALIGIVIRSILRRICLIVSHVFLVVLNVLLLRRRILALGIRATGEQTGKHNGDHTSTDDEFCLHCLLFYGNDS